MKVRIGHAIHDENNKAKGGQAGDQTGGEVKIAEWYNKPWTNVFRPKDDDDAEMIAATAEAICVNDYIGYDQSQRTTLFNAAEKVDFDIEAIESPCETDCSAMVAVCVNAAGIRVSKNMYTGNELSMLRNTGKFDIFTTDDYCRSSDKLKRGDILLGNGHTAVVLTDGAKADAGYDEPSEEEPDNENPFTGQGIGVATAKGSMHIRSEATSLSRSYAIISRGEQVEVLDILNNGWYKIVWDDAPNGYAYTSNVDGKYYLYDGEIPEHTGDKYVLTGNYNIRKTPGADNKPRGDIIAIARKGAIFTSTGESVDVDGTAWLYGTCGSFNGYISSKGLREF